MPSPRKTCEPIANNPQDSNVNFSDTHSAACFQLPNTSNKKSSENVVQAGNTPKLGIISSDESNIQLSNLGLPPMPGSVSSTAAGTPEHVALVRLVAEAVMQQQQHQQQEQLQQQFPSLNSPTLGSAYNDSKDFVYEGRSIKLFVGSLPYRVTEADLYPVFSKFGVIIELVIQRSHDGRSKGCAWLRYQTKSECDECIKSLHNKYYCAPSSSPMQVKYAIGELERYENKLFIGGVPMHLDEATIGNSLAETYGAIKEVFGLRRTVASAQAVFVKFVREESVTRLMYDSHNRNVYIAGMFCPSVRVSYAQDSRYNSYSQNQTSGFADLPLGEISVQPTTPPYYDSNNELIETQLEGHTSEDGYTIPNIGICRSPCLNNNLQNPLQPAPLNVRNKYHYRLPTSSIPPGLDTTNRGRLSVTNVPNSRSVMDLAALFSQCGCVLEVHLGGIESQITSHGKALSPGCASVTMANPQEALKCVEVFNNYRFTAKKNEASEDDAQEGRALCVAVQWLESSSRRSPAKYQQQQSLLQHTSNMLKPGTSGLNITTPLLSAGAVNLPSVPPLPFASAQGGIVAPAINSSPPTATPVPDNATAVANSTSVLSSWMMATAAAMAMQAVVDAAAVAQQQQLQQRPPPAQSQNQNLQGFLNTDDNIGTQDGNKKSE